MRVSTLLCSTPVAGWVISRLANYYVFPQLVATDNGDVDNVFNFVSLIQDMNEKWEDERQHFTLWLNCLDPDSWKALNHR